MVGGGATAGVGAGLVASTAGLLRADSFCEVCGPVVVVVDEVVELLLEEVVLVRRGAAVDTASAFAGPVMAGDCGRGVRPAVDAAMTPPARSNGNKLSKARPVTVRTNVRAPPRMLVLLDAAALYVQ